MNPLQAKRIVVIEDDQDYLDMLKIRLNINGFDVFTASEALKGLGLIRSMKPDLVILDLRLPGMCATDAEDVDRHMGQKICRMIKFDAKLRHIPVLMLTCSDSADDIEQSIKSGADSYLMKTASTEFLIHEVRRMLGLKRHQMADAAAV